MPKVIHVVASVVAVLVLVAACCLYLAFSTAVRAEHALHGALLTVELLEDYVVRHDGKWPRSWADLEGLPPRDRGFFQWPKDSQEVQRYVAVDFSADPQRLAQQGIDQFEAVRAIGPYYPFNDHPSVEALLKAIRQRKITEPKAVSNPSPAPLVGSYYRGDGLGLNLHLALNKDGTFECRWTGCLGEYGKSSGRWSGDERHIKTHAEVAEGMLKDRPVGDLEVGQSNGKTILIQINRRDYFDRVGASRSSCFHRKADVPDF